MTSAQNHLLSRRQVLGGAVTAAGLSLLTASARAETTFKPISTQFLAALGEPTATSGTGAEAWGLWRIDPGPRGVRLSNFPKLVAQGGVAPSQWQFDAKDWWLEEHGLIMEQPEFGVAPGQYVVTGARAVTTILTIHPKDPSGQQRWELAGGATLHDVTHLRCRSARYRPGPDGKPCTPANVSQEQFPVQPGAAMPPVSGCDKLDYAVLFIVGVEA